MITMLCCYDMPHPYLACDLFVVKVKDKDLKVGKGTVSL